MSEFNPNKLSVYYKDNILPKEFAIPRKYTLTHSDITAQLFLTIGKDYDYNKISDMRDEVLATWKETDKGNILEVFLHLDSEYGLGALIIRDKIFRQELPLALKAIVYAEKNLFEANENLLDAKIIVYFKSKIAEYNVVEEWGKIKDYIIDIRRSNGKTQEEILKESEQVSQQLEIQYPYDSVSSPYHSAQIPFMHIGAPYTLPPMVPTGNPNGKSHIIEKALIITLEPYIENQVNNVFGENTKYCLQKAKLIDANLVNYACKCLDEYEVVIGLMVGEKLPIYNNFIIRFLISEKEIKVLDTKVIK